MTVRIKDVDIGDLLGRPSAEPISSLMSKNIVGKSVMVSGAGGSIGSELCRQIVAIKPSTLVLFDMSEFALYTIEVELRRLDKALKIYAILGSVQNFDRVNDVMYKFGVQTIYHAAAYKHVPMVEYNITEGVINNMIGTQNMVVAAGANHVETFVLVSTDKAVRPTNVMGASKRIAEMIVQAHADIGGPTVYSMVRFGNVLGSSGSVVPLFLEQMARGEPLTITHPDITRYFMSIPEAAQLVIQAGAMAQGGDVFVLDMGEPVRIIDLAYRMLETQGSDIDSYGIKITGLRPGEKLYEELLIGDNVTQTDHPLIMRANESFISYAALTRHTELIEGYCNRGEFQNVLSEFREIVSGFSHTSEIKDHLYN